MKKVLRIVWKIVIYLFAAFGAIVMVYNTMAKVVIEKKEHKEYFVEKVTLLKEAGGYNQELSADLPEFKYDTTGVYKVKEYFMLDTLVCGVDDQWQQALIIEEWLHDNIRHDGSRTYDGNRNVIDIWNYAKENNVGVNCRILAIALHELYLSMGMTARYITCMPMDENDNECHVINEVWIDNLDKWVWIDPSFHAYLTDKNGNLLSIQEVREYFKEDKKVVLNEDANWNGSQYAESKYLPYMAKNLYWFNIPSIFGLNVESKEIDIAKGEVLEWQKNRQYVMLCPEGFNGFGISVLSNEQITNNDDYYWQAPK